MFSTVYAIQIKDQNLFKIGYAADPEKRLKELQVGNPFDLILYAKIETLFAVDVERFIHAMLAGCEVRGEWFRVEPEVIDEVLGFPMNDAGFTVHKFGDDSMASYAIIPTAHSDIDGKIALSSQCVTAGELQTECIRLMKSLMKILVQARKVQQ